MLGACIHLAQLSLLALVLLVPWGYSLRAMLDDPLAGRQLLYRAGQWYFGSSVALLPIVPMTAQVRTELFVSFGWRSLDGSQCGRMFVFADSCDSSLYRRLRCRLLCQG